MFSEYFHILKDSLLSVPYLVFPKICLICEKELPIKNDIICLSCKLQMPFTDQFSIDENELELRLAGRIKIESAAALFHLHGEGSVEKLIHLLKYANRPDVGIQLGQNFGSKLKQSTRFLKIDYIIPIPLHKKKEAKRGYNQCMKIATGISEITGVPILKEVLVKKKEISSQTSKGRIERLKNVEDTFELIKYEGLKDKHILLIDDVITTGATIEAATNKLFKIDGLKLSLGFIAMKLQE